MESKFKFLKKANHIYLIIILILSFNLFMKGSHVIAILSVIVLGITNVISSIFIKKRETQINEVIEDFNMNLDTVYKNTLLNMPLPMMIVSNKGTILWANSSCSIINENKKILSRNINTVFNDINTTKLLKSDKDYYKDVEINNSFYDLYTSKIKHNVNKDEDVNLFYLVNSEKRHEIEKKYKEERYVVIILEVDNLEEVLRDIEEERRPILLANIERKIIAYGQKMHGITRKYTSNRYIIIVERKYIEEEIENKFNILDEVKEINAGERLVVTISMGVGLNGENPLDSQDSAISAIELALGRGGDQVVVKNKDKFLFFGGKSKEVEKRTKVKSRVIGHAIKDIVRSSENVLILGHNNPDIDCIGSAIGLNSVITAMGKQCNIVLDSLNASIEDIVTKYIEEENKENVFVTGEDVLDYIGDNTLFIIVDTNNRKYVANKELLKGNSNMIIIDHHRKSLDSIEDASLSYIEPYASATSELVTEIIPYIKEGHKLSYMEAEALLAGITVDTKNFTFKTGVKTFEAAAYLKRLGADTVEIKKLFSCDLDRMIKRCDIIKSAKVNNGIAIARCPKEVEDKLLAAQAADELLDITGIEASFVLVKIGNNVTISGRSLGQINVQLILEAMGGGGHLTMAGATVNDRTLDEAQLMLEEAINKYLREGEEK